MTGNPQFSQKNSTTTTACESSDSMTVMGLLKDISQKVSNIEVLLGGGSSSSGLPPSAGRPKSDKGIDIVLGAQWGDEGKGKLVDMLSQVRIVLLFSVIKVTFVCSYGTETDGLTLFILSL